MTRGSTNHSSPGHGLDQPGALVLHRLQLRPQLVVVAAVTLRTLQHPHFILEVSTKLRDSYYNIWTSENNYN